MAKYKHVRHWLHYMYTILLIVVLIHMTILSIVVLIHMTILLIVVVVLIHILFFI